MASSARPASRNEDYDERGWKNDLPSEERERGRSSASNETWSVTADAADGAAVPPPDVAEGVAAAAAARNRATSARRLSFSLRNAAQSAVQGAGSSIFFAPELDEGVPSFHLGLHQSMVARVLERYRMAAAENKIWIAANVSTSLPFM